ncbi:DUF3352 domain-containing protein [Isoptericola sp. S6320L]|uniref:DUF3352 domain-containing protein n=1 Tax=Isoptericola sp. S6320L TaxID=2926411 RepID=UPI001FF62F1B|nr:DUF3352 domain-containing protein [Isoptericola sp. S6320L]MCK0117551.1 DUF3352 domain-containing protein [Isoptericola sp. S6320L]
MTDHPPPYPGTPAEPPTDGTAEPAAHAEAAAAAPVRRSRKGLVIGGSIAAGLLVLGGAGAAAYAMLDGGGAQPEAALPASTIGYVRVDLDPSAEQKINLLRLADRLPDLSADLGVEIDEDSDLKQVIAEAVTASGECDLDYDADIAPWIGDRGALAAVPGADGEPQPVWVLAVTDEDAARPALESGLGCGETIGADQVAFTEGYAIVTDGAPAADVVADTEQGSLADDATFAADMAALGDPGLVSFWADAEAALDWSLAAIPELTDGALPENDLKNLEALTTAAGALRVNPDGIELETLSAGDEAVVAPYRASGTSVTTELPETTLLALGGSTTPDAVDDAWEQFRELYDSMGSSLGGGALMSSTGAGVTAPTGRTAPTGPVGGDVDPLEEYCLEASKESLGITGDDLSDDEQMMIDVFMDACTGAAAEEPTTVADDPWGGAGQPDFDGMVALLEEEYDLRLPDDLKTLVGEQVVLAVDSRGLESLDAVEGMDDVSAGLRTVGDTDALQDLSGRIDSLLTESDMDPLATSPADDGFVFATNGAYADELAGDGGLGSTDAYRSVVSPEDVSSVLYVDLDRLTEVLRPVLESDPTALGYLEPLRAAGMTTSADDTYAKATFRVSFD